MKGRRRRWRRLLLERGKGSRGAGDFHKPRGLHDTCADRTDIYKSVSSIYFLRINITSTSAGNCLECLKTQKKRPPVCSKFLS